MASHVDLSDDRGTMSFAAAPYSGLSDLSAQAVSTVDLVAEEVRRSLFAGEIVPGTPLREVALAQALGVARSTVREALGVLVAEGVADRLPRRGIVVRRMDAAQVRDVSRSRLVVERAGVRAWPVASPTSRAALRAALEDYTEAFRTEGPIAEFTAAHLGLHRAIVALAGSERLLAFADGLYAEIRVALAQVDRARGNAAEQVHSHALLVDLVESGDTEAALAELTAHLDEAEESMIDFLGSRDEA